jgi:cytochrome P450
LRSDPALLPTAVEELLRTYSPVTMGRMVTRDTEIGGCRMRAGDKVLLSFPAANRDPARFEAPDEVRIDREVNPHLAFGTGIHRCLGSNLARMELRVGLATFLELVPPFELAPRSRVVWTGGQVRGPRQVPIVSR